MRSGIVSRGWLFFHAKTAVPRRPRVLVYPRDVESALLGWVPRGSQGSCPLPGSKVGPTVKPWGLGSGPWEIQDEFISPYRFHKAALLHGNRKGGQQRCVLGWEGRWRASGSQLFWFLEAPERHQARYRYTQEELTGWLLGRLGGPPSRSGHRRLPTFLPAVRKSSACTWTHHGAEPSWLQYCL